MVGFIWTWPVKDSGQRFERGLGVFPCVAQHGLSLLAALKHMRGHHTVGKSVKTCLHDALVRHETSTNAVANGWFRQGKTKPMSLWGLIIILLVWLFEAWATHIAVFDN